MTMMAHDSTSARTALGDDASRSGLRLVVSGRVEGQRSMAAADAAAVPCLELKSAMEERSPVLKSVLTEMFKRLRPGERIEFVHRIAKGDADRGTVPPAYRMSLRVACPSERLVPLKKELDEAILTAYPGYYFEATPESLARIRERYLPHAVQFTLAGAVVAANPALTNISRNTDEPMPLVNRGGAKDGRQDKRVWPFPGELANWALTVPLYEPLNLPDELEVNVRVHGFALDDAACAALHKTMHRVLAGNLNVFHPESPISAYSASDQLTKTAVELVGHWLRHPTGYAVDCVVCSSSPLGEVAECRIAWDVFGPRPFERLRSFLGSQPQRLMPPTLSWAIAAEQGIPALLPGQQLLHTLAIPRHYAPPTVTPPTCGARLGETVSGHRSCTVALPASSRSRHVALFGSTGSGKSSLLTQMIAEDIADPNRSCGVGLIDPHGDLYQRVLEHIPPERERDVVLIDTSDLIRTVCINPLEGMRDDPVYAQFVVSEIMALIEMLFEGQDTSGPLMRNNLRNLLHLASSSPDRGTFLDALRILEDSEYCDYVLIHCTNRNVVDYWSKFRQTRNSDHGYVEWAPYMMARLAPFTSNPIMKRLINRPKSTIDLVEAMRERRIVLFNLSKGVLQDIECQVLGSLILMKFFGAAIGRARQPEAERVPFHLYVDEFQTFATDSVPRLFSEARKFGLCLTTANQSLSQLGNRWGRSNIGESVLANTASKFLFRLGPADAEMLRPYFKPHFDDAAMATLPDFHAVACMSDNNRPLPPFVFLADQAVPDVKLHVPLTDLVRWSDEQYSVSVAEANTELMKLYDLSRESLGL